MIGLPQEADFLDRKVRRSCFSFSMTLNYRANGILAQSNLPADQPIAETAFSQQIGLSAYADNTPLSPPC